MHQESYPNNIGFNFPLIQINGRVCGFGWVKKSFYIFSLHLYLVYFLHISKFVHVERNKFLELFTWTWGLCTSAWPWLGGTRRCSAARQEPKQRYKNIVAHATVTLHHYNITVMSLRLQNNTILQHYSIVTIQ